MRKVAVVIPAFEPDKRLISLADTLTVNGIGPIYIVNDGSGQVYDDIFDRAGDIVRKNGGAVLRHETNKGKGRALKTAFAYILENAGDVEAVVTADSDGQHSYECIRRVIEASAENQDCLILGVRTFENTDIPWKSRFGNQLTKKVFRYITGTYISDTQTGLRAIPVSYLPELLDIRGERFEFEMRMLVDAVDKIRIIEIPVQTIYDSKENHQTHFDPVRDSVRIYRILGERFFKFFLTSMSSCLLDMVIFGVLCRILKTKHPALYIAYSTVAARVISAIYNYFMNYKVVFKSQENVGKAAVKYFLLAVLQMSCSAALVTGLVRMCPGVTELLLKAVVDTTLFFISYSIQQRLVF